MTDYARQLAAHPRWVWQPGMVTANGHAVSQDDLDDEFSPAGVRPDIHHPATRGWLLHMLREAMGHDLVACVPHPDGGWIVTADRPGLPDEVSRADTEGDALAAALLAVWGAS